MNEAFELLKTQLSSTEFFMQEPNINDDDVMHIVNANRAYQDQWTRVHHDLVVMEANCNFKVWDELTSEDFENDEIMNFVLNADEKFGPFLRNGSVVGDVMDDMSLLARAARVNYCDAWLDEIWNDYQAGKFPRLK